MDKAGRKSTAAGKPRKEKKRIAGVDVTLTWPTPSSANNASSSASSPRGVAFLLPGAMIATSEYDGLRDVILERQYLVVSLYVNVLWPPRDNHRKHARDVKRVFDQLKTAYAYLPDCYSVVGHSAGGKIALLLASVVDPSRVSSVLSLDPVDVNPVEFSNAKGPNLPLDDDAALCSDDIEHGADVVILRFRERRAAEDGDEENRIPIFLTCTDGGRGIPKAHDAEAIHGLHPNTICHHHDHAGHMAYCDHGGGRLAGLLMPDVGTKEGNERARAAARELIHHILR